MCPAPATVRFCEHTHARTRACTRQYSHPRISRSRTAALCAATHAAANNRARTHARTRLRRRCVRCCDAPRLRPVVSRRRTSRLHRPLTMERNRRRRGRVLLQRDDAGDPVGEARRRRLRLCRRHQAAGERRRTRVPRVPRVPRALPSRVWSSSARARRDALPSVWSLQHITQIDQAAVAHRDAPAGAVASEPPGAAAAHGTAPRAGQGARGREGGVICEATAWGGVCRRSWRANGRRRRRRTASRASPH